MGRLSSNISCVIGFVYTGKWKGKWYETIGVHRTESTTDLISLITKMPWQEQAEL